MRLNSSNSFYRSNRFLTGSRSFRLVKLLIDMVRVSSQSLTTHVMKIISQKQGELAIEYVAEMLKRDGGLQTQTVQEWLDIAQLHPAQYPSSLPALEILGLLGFGGAMVHAHQPA